MDNWQKEALEPFLDVWARHMEDNNSELRQLLYPPRAVGTYDRLTVSRNDEESEIWAVLEVMKGAIDSLTVEQKIAVELAHGLRTVVEIDNPAQRLDEAQNSIWRSLVAHGFLVGGAA